MSAYFKPSEDAGIIAGQMAWWCDELQDWTLEQVVWSMRQWNRENPRLRPTPGDILSILLVTRGKREADRAKASAPQEPTREEVILTADQRAERQAALADVAASLKAKAMGLSEK